MDKTIKIIDSISNWIDRCYKRGDLLEFKNMMEVGIEGANHIRQLLFICVGLMRPDEVERDVAGFSLYDSIIGGHMARIYKLYDQMVLSVNENKGEIVLIFQRLIFESYARMRYLTIKGEESIKSFIKTSFKADINNYKFLKEIKKERSLSNIEKRIYYKIETRIKRVNLDIEDLLQNTDWKIDGKSFYDILVFLRKNDIDGYNWEAAYSFLFGSGSAFIHGSWYDIEYNHLQEKNGSYLPKFSYKPVDPRYILPYSLPPIHACKDYIIWRKLDSYEFLLKVLDKFKDFLFYLNDMDEIRIDKNVAHTRS